MIHIFIFLICLTVNCFSDSSVNFFSPKTDFRSYKSHVLFKGIVDDVRELKINGHPIELYENRFFVKAQLTPYYSNKFSVELTDQLNQTTEILRHIEYFPTKNIQLLDYIFIHSIEFNPLKNRWEISGKVEDVKSLYIEKKNVPIDENGLFFYFFNPHQLGEKKQFITLTAMSNDLVLISQELALHETTAVQENDLIKANIFTDYMDIQAAILSSYHQREWQLIPFNTVQEKMINYLIEEEIDYITLKDIKLLKNDDFIVVSLPYLSDSIEIGNISYRLMMILQNTLDITNISILWFNKVPETVEVVYTNGYNVYWLINNDMFSLKDAMTSKLLAMFKGNYFLAE